MNKHKQKLFNESIERLIPDESLLLNKKMIRDHFSRYEFALPFIKNKKVLDIACGVGYGSKMLADNGAKMVVGVDISHQAIGYAKNRYPHKNVNFVKADVSHIPFKNNLFDVVVSFETIEHLKSAEEFVKEISRVLKKRGLLILSSPNGLYKHVFENPFHYNELELGELKKLINGYFTNIRLYGQQNVPVFYMSLIRKLFCIIKSSKLKWFLRSSFLFIFRSYEVIKINDNNNIQPLIYVLKAYKV